MAGYGRYVRVGERPRGGDNRVPDEAAPIGHLYCEARAVGDDVDDAGIRPHLNVEQVGVATEVVDDLVAARVAVRVAGERVPRERAELARGEQAQAVVVVRPRPDRLLAGLEHHRLPAAVAPSTGGSQARLPAAHDQQATPPAHPSVLVPIWTSCGAGAQHPPDDACSGASNRPDPPHTPVSGSSSSTRSAAS